MRVVSLGVTEEEAFMESLKFAQGTLSFQLRVALNTYKVPLCDSIESQRVDDLACLI